MEEPTSSQWVLENFIVGDVIGSGTFGNVYKVNPIRNPKQTYAMKQLSRNSAPHTIATELSILKHLGGAHNIMCLIAAHRESDRVFIIMDYFKHTPFKDFLSTVKLSEIMLYMENLLDALRYLHSNSIIHRDIKPSNFLYNQETKKFCLIDFGLSEAKKMASHTDQMQEYVDSVIDSRKRLRLNCDENTTNNTAKVNEGYYCSCFGLPRVCQQCRKRPRHIVNKAGTPGFRAPEVLLKFSAQTALVDIWAAGITLLSLLCKKHPLFRPLDDFEAIAQLLALFGTKEMEEMAIKNHVLIVTSLEYPGVDLIKFVQAVRNDLSSAAFTEQCSVCRSLFYENYGGSCLCRTSNEKFENDFTADEKRMFDVLERCLTIDPEQRYTAEMLLKKFF